MRVDYVRGHTDNRGTQHGHRYYPPYCHQGALKAAVYPRPLVEWSCRPHAGHNGPDHEKRC